MNDANGSLPRTLRVIDQGMADGLHVVFACGNPTQCSGPTTVDASAAALATQGSSVDLAFDFPVGCFDAFTAKCSFEIGVDVSDAVQESSEINNTAAGVCGPQIF
jgi:hypothetical protein